MTRLVCLTSVLALSAGAAAAQEMNFNRIASFPVAANLPEGMDAATETSAEIMVATPDGQRLVYSDSPLEAIGIVDISDPANPAPAGTVMLDGEPTSVTVVGANMFVSVNTSESYTDPSGYLTVRAVDGGAELARCDLGGQPDAIAAAPDGSFLAVAIENERDEDLGEGRVPQMPPGDVVMFDIADGVVDCDSERRADLTGLAEVAPEDPEPEFVDINAAGDVVVSLQENNHLVVLSSAGEVLSHFSAGAVDLENIDTREEGALLFEDTQTGVVREPDTVKWFDETHFVTANEGDMDGGSRGWTIFHRDGTVVYESGTSFEHAIVQIGHYPEERSGNKGVEPESIAVGTYGGTPMIFVGSERGNVIGVYDATDPANPVLKQILPTAIGPESFAVLTERGLLAAANEVDGGEDGFARAYVTVYELQDAPASYPHLTSEGMDTLTGWGAISGQVASEDGLIYAVNDSFYGMQPTIFAIDPSGDRAQITEAIRVTREGAPAQLLDLEGITLDGEGGFWLASEGRLGRGILHAIYHVGADGEIQDTIPFPKEIMGVERRWAAEGIARVGDTLWITLQREFDDDPENMVKLLAYDTESGEWGAVHYEREAPEQGWIGLSDIATSGDNAYSIERDNQIGEAARVKKIYRVALSEMTPAPLDGDDPLPVVEKSEVRDLIGDLTSTGGYVLDKVEGIAIMSDGTAWISTDNDGVDDHSGETMFFSIGNIEG